MGVLIKWKVVHITRKTVNDPPCNLIMGVMTHYLFVLYYVPLSSNLTIEIFQECWTNAETTKQRAVNDTFYLICIHIFPLGSLTRHALFDASWIDGLMCLV